MLSSHAAPLLHCMGFEGDPAPQGIITVEKLPAAIAALEATIANEDRNALLAQAEQEAQRHEEMTGERLHPIQAPVLLSQRAYPLLQMLKSALATNEPAPVLWQSESAW